MEVSAHDVTPRWQRWLLPAILGAPWVERDAHGGTRLPRSARDWLVDLVLCGGAVLIGGAILFSDIHRDGHNNRVGLGLLVVDGILFLITLGALWFRRRDPVVVGWLTMALALVSDAAAGTALVALLTVSVRCSPRLTLPLAATAVLDGPTRALLYPDHGVIGPLTVWTAVVIMTVAFGAYVRVRRELVLSLHERAYRVEGEQALRVREAQLAERARIAREMHDVLAHRISLLSLHAGALEFNPTASPEEIARAASVIRESARAAQEELRDVIGVLRTGDNELDGEARTSEPPQPTIADLDRLVEESRRAGMELTLVNDVGELALSPVAGRTVYRLVQEALTNARKHAPGQVVSISVRADGDSADVIRVEVVNRPRVGQSAVSVSVSDSDDPVTSGMGLVGLNERVTLAGGTLSTESLPGGGFRLLAVLPAGHGESEER